MSDTTAAGPWALPRDEAVDMPRPDPFALAGPVLIGDVATPLGGETLLSLLLRRMEETDR